MFAVATTLAQTLVGVPVFVALLGIGLRIVWLRAARHGVLKPVLVGLMLRLVVMIAAHVASAHGGDGGFYYLDDHGYHRDAEAISSAWLHGDIVNPSAVDYAGSSSFGYPVLVAVVYALIGPVTLGAKLVNVLIGGAVVLLVGLLAGRLLGERARGAAAWLTALLPTLVWWSAPLMKEPLVAFLLMAGLLGALSLPRLTALAGLLVAVAGLLLTRIQGAAVLAGTVAIVGLASASHAQRGRTARFVIAGGAILVLLALAFHGEGPSQLIADLRRNGADMLDVYGARHPTPWPYDAAKSLLGPFPWVFSATTENWDRALYPGVWVLYALYPTILMGLWRLRSRPFVFAYLALPIAAFLVINAIFAGLAFRQRSSIEPLLVVLAIAGADSARVVARRGAVAIALVAPVALVHAGSVPLALVIAAAAAVIWLISRQLPSSPTQMLAGVERTRPLNLAISRADVTDAVRAAKRATRLWKRKLPPSRPS